MDVLEVACWVDYLDDGVVDKLVNVTAPLLAAMKALIEEL